MLIEFKKGRHDGPPPHPPRLSLVLHMDGETAKWVDAEFNRHMQEKEAFLRRQKRIRSNITLDLQDDRNLSRFAEISKLQFKIDSCTFDHFARIKSRCNKKQAKRLSEVIRRVIERNDRPRPKRW